MKARGTVRVCDAFMQPTPHTASLEWPAWPPRSLAPTLLESKMRSIVLIDFAGMLLTGIGSAASSDEEEVPSHKAASSQRVPSTLLGTLAAVGTLAAIGSAAR